MKQSEKHRDALSPVVGKQFFIVGVQGTGCRKHDGGVKVADNAANGAGSIDTCLCAPGTGLQCQQYIGHLDMQQMLLNANAIKNYYNYYYYYYYYYYTTTTATATTTKTN